MITRKGAIIILTLFVVACQHNGGDLNDLSETEPPVLTAHNIIVNEQIRGYYSGLPSRYHKSTKKYPLIIWIHGNGQIGNGNTDLHKVLFGGIPKLLDEKKFPPSFQVNGQTHSFISLMPQFISWPVSNQLLSFISFAKNNYRVDESRIYLAGLSMGGIITADFSAEYARQFAAVVPIAGVSISGDIPLKCKNIAIANLPVWVFQNTGDDVFNVENARKYIQILHAQKPGINPRYTELIPFGENGHDAWTTATDPAYREDGMNIYEWMLRYTR